MGKYRYREVKNYIHNELKLTKEDIKEIMVPIVKEEVKRIFQNTYGNDVDIERWVRCMVSNEIQRHGDYSMIRNLCREIIKEEIADRLSIDISLKKKEKHLWTNRLELAYGLNKTGEDGTRKANDKIYLNTNYGYSIAKNWYASAFATFQTQFSPGYDYSINKDVSISEFMAPGYLTTGLGFTYDPGKIFTVVLSPASWRGTFVLNDRLSDEGAYGVDPGKHLLSAFGANLKGEVKYEFLKNMTVYSRLDLYSDYLHKPLNIDVNWEVQVNMIINKWFSTTLTTNLMYDDDVKIAQKDGTKGSRVQFKEILGVGVQFNF